MTAGPAEAPQPEVVRPTPGWSRRATPLVFLALSVRTFGQLLGGDLTIEAAAVRCLVALVVAMVAMHLLEGIVRSYTTDPEPEPAVVEPEPVIAEPAPARRAEDVPEPA